jgi:hypothetical protein
MFKFTLLANVVPPQAPGQAFYLGIVARGFAMTIGNEQKIVSSANTLGGDLGMFGKTILKENEQILDQDVRQVARTPTMMIFDAKAVMRRGDDHVNMIMRHALLVDPATGRLYTLVWLLTNNYEAAEETMQLLPEGMWEKRYLSVKRDKFTLGIPSKDAFALRQVPQGTPVRYTPKLYAAATTREFTEQSVPAIEAILRTTASGAAGH